MVTFAEKLQKRVLVSRKLAWLCSSLLRNRVGGGLGLGSQHIFKCRITKGKGGLCSPSLHNLEFFLLFGSR